MSYLKNKILEDLERMGILADDTLLVHSSYKSLGEPSLTAKAFLQTLLDYLSRGTLLFPALSYTFVTPQNPCFDFDHPL